MAKYLIAGVDPGATVGVALVDLSGRKIGTFSFEGGISEAARVIEKHGTPSLLAVDVSPPPEMAQKLASYFSCRLYAPHKEIREDDKKKIAQGSGVKNNHERDAYAAAVYAYRSSANKLRQIDSLAELSHEEKERVKHLMLKGYRLIDAFASLSAEGASAPAQMAPKHQARKLSYEELASRVSSLARENSNLRLLSERLESEKRQLSERMRMFENGVRQKMLIDNEIRKLSYQLKSLQQRLSFRKAPKPLQQKKPPVSQKNPLPQNPATINNPEDSKVDLDKLVAEYRKGRK